MKTNSRNNTQKKKIINNIFNSVGIPSLYAAKIINDIIEILISNLKKKNYIKIKGFGIFNLKKKKKRAGRDPKTKTVYEINERHILTFKASVNLIKKVNTNVKK